jgi:uncharacterized membrane protein
MPNHIPPNQKNDVTLYDEAKDAKDSKSPTVFRNFRFLGFLGFFLCFMLPYGYYHGFESFLFYVITIAAVIIIF